jgi:hypothetical protein
MLAFPFFGAGPSFALSAGWRQDSNRWSGQETRERGRTTTIAESKGLNGARNMFWKHLAGRSALIFFLVAALMAYEIAKGEQTFYSLNPPESYAVRWAILAVSVSYSFLTAVFAIVEELQEIRKSLDGIRKEIEWADLRRLRLALEEKQSS